MGVRSVLILSSLLLVCCQLATGQRILNLKTGSFPLLTPVVTRNAPETQYLFYVSDDVISETEKALLSGSGVDLLYALKDNVYWVRIKGLQEEDISTHLFDLNPAYKLGISIDERSAVYKLRLSIAQGLTLSEIQAWAESNGIILLDARSIASGLMDVDIRSSSVETLLNTPWVSFIDHIPQDEEVNFRLLHGERGWGLISPLTRNLDGTGMTIGIGDGGRLGVHDDISESILDLASFGISNHSTQVTGIVTGTGLLDPAFGSGYAPNANVIIRNFSDILWDTPQYIEDFDLSLTNNSYSSNPFDCAYIGDYNGTSMALDAMANNYPQLLHVFAAGNSGTMTCLPFPQRYATIAGGYQSSKNVLTVGATRIFDAVALFSSRGPVDDGRLKPEVVAYGEGRFSTINNNGYSSNSGTSFSSPATVGLATLLYQRYRELHNDSLPDAALIKNVICNGADDLGLTGPDFSFGFGRINGVRSVEILETGAYHSVNVIQNSTIFKTFTAPSGVASIDVMLMWSDHPSAPYETVALVNDLDLIVIDPSGDTIKPWSLNYTPAGVAIPATTGPDHTNNQEQITVSTAEQGVYTIIVKGYHIPMGPQKAWLSWDIQMNGITLQSPDGGEIFKPSLTDAQYIRWDAFGTGNSLFNVDYSTDGGLNWAPVAVNVPATQRYQNWFIPNTPTDNFRVRVTASNGMTDTSDDNAVIMAPPANLIVTSPCDGYVQASWNAVTGADYYMVYSLKNELLTILDTTSNLNIILGGFDPGQSQRITVAGVFPSGKTGLRARAVLVSANGGVNCSWNHDLRIDSLLNPFSGRQLTSSSLTPAENIEIYLTNAGLLPASGFSLSYQVNNNSIITESFAGTLNPGTSQYFTFSQTSDLSSIGDYQIRVWTTYASDPFHQNDTLSTSIDQLPNPVVWLPWSEDFETIPDTQFTSSSIGMANHNAWDIILEDTARIRTFAGSPFCHSGQRALTMDAVKNVSAETGNVLLTLNMIKYNAATQDIRMSLHYMHHEIIPDLVNTESIQIRGSDTDTFLLLTPLGNEAEDRGVWQNLSGLEISELLMDANQNFSSSFQIRFPFSVNATAGQIISQDGQTIDDISFQLIDGDLKMNSLIHPAGVSCGLGVESIEVSISNTGNMIMTDPVVYYQLNGGAIQSTPIDDIPADTTMNFILSPAADFSLPGIYDLLVWVTSANDDLHQNDTIRTEILHVPLITDFPYKEGFEMSNGDYVSGGINSTWSHGMPGKEIISRAAEGQNVWTTALSGTHNADEKSYLYSPCFDITGLSQPYLSFAFQYQLEINFDFAWIEYRLADSSDWIKLGSQGSGTNWYNHASHTWNGTQSKWITTGIAIPVTNTIIQFRWVMQSDVGVEQEGIAVDQVHIYDKIPIYTGLPSQWTVPVSGNNWVHIDQGGQRVFSIHPQGQDLGNVTLTLFKSSQNFIPADSFYLLSRSWVITSTNTFSTDIALRAYYSTVEAGNLVSATGCSQCIKSRDGFDVAAVRYSGINEDGLYNNNVATGVTTFDNDSIRVYPYENGYYAEWSVDSLSEWWISTPVTKKSGTLIRRVSSAGDDAEEHENNGCVNPVHEILSLTDYKGHQKVGWRFKNITIPAGSYISSATLAWTSSGSISDSANWTLQSEIFPDANSFTTHKYNISLRPRSDQVVQWSPTPWLNDQDYSSPDIRHLIQKVTDQPAWVNGNDLVLIMSGSGLREAWSYDGDPLKTAVLEITFGELCTENGILYVDKNASGLQDGSSWTNAYKSLEQALDRTDHCPGISQIWIADGIYSPFPEVSRTNSFNIRQGVSIYGGFQGNETSISQRIPGVFPTILSGDIGIQGNLSDNLYHVVSILPGISNVILDGITIEKGMANGPISQQQTGAGIFNQGNLNCNQVILRSNSYPSLANDPGSRLTSTGILEIRQ